MNYLLHRHRSPGALVGIMQPLEELMQEISREVLRTQPPDVIVFLADYLEEKLASRENRRVAEKVVDNVLDASLDIVAMLESVGIDAVRAEDAVKCIREEFHRHFETKTDDERLRETFRERVVLERLVKECHFNEQEARRASRIIEEAYRTYYFRNAYKEPHGPGKDKDWRQAAKHTLGLYAQTGPTKEEMEAAAQRIQTAYRAYYTRKRQELDRNATIIQRAVRGHQSRQQRDDALDGVPSVVLAHESFVDRKDRLTDAYSPSEELQNLIDLAIGGKRRFSSRSVHSVPSKETTKLASSVESQHSPDGTPEMGEEQAAALLQSTARGHLARRRVQEKKRQQQHNEMATLLQSHARGYLARKRHTRNQADGSGGPSEPEKP
uniref:RIIa domain-containing protein n=1 Tax=Anopheles dirus TaxID=7168 RepID=A0A182NRN3_9DIPT